MKVIVNSAFESPGLEQKLKDLRANRDRKLFPRNEDFYDFLEVRRNAWWYWEKGSRPINLTAIRSIESKLETSLDVQIPNI
jgi:hypothetical protein